MVDAVAVAAEIKRFAPAGAALLLDSRKIRKGDVFFAVKGVHTDGRAFIGKSLRRRRFPAWLLKKAISARARCPSSK